MKTILVTGGCGYIGSHVCVELLKNPNYSVIIIDNLSNSNINVLDSIQKISNRTVTMYHDDLRDLESLRTIFKEENIDAVIHLAGLKAVGESVQNPLRYYDNNVVGTVNLLKTMEQHKVTKLIFSSSATVYGKTDQTRISEDSHLCPSNPYGHTKLFIEEMLKNCTNLSYVSLRYFNPIGCDPSGLIYDNPEGIPNNLMPYLIQILQGKRNKFYIFGNDYPTRDGTAVRDYINVCDLARGHIASLEYIFDKQVQDTFNLGTGEGTTVLEILEAFEKANNIKINYEISPRRQGDVPILIADSRKANAILNWKPEYSLHQSCIVLEKMKK